jgi:tripartite-type tricarboxylate transporter receptor subunit TctC
MFGAGDEKARAVARDQMCTWQSSRNNVALADPKIKTRLFELGGEPLELSAADFGRLITAETDKWSKVIRGANIKPN